MEFERVTRLSVPEEIIENVKEKIVSGEFTARRPASFRNKTGRNVRCWPWNGTRGDEGYVLSRAHRPQ
jgi:hypothetical protein